MLLTRIVVMLLAITSVAAHANQISVTLTVQNPEVWILTADTGLMPFTAARATFRATFDSSEVARPVPTGDRVETPILLSIAGLPDILIQYPHTNVSIAEVDATNSRLEFSWPLVAPYVFGGVSGTGAGLHANHLQSPIAATVAAMSGSGSLPMSGMLSFVLPDGRQVLLRVTATTPSQAVIDEAPTATAVEYVHALWGYYFITAFPAEVDLLDRGGYQNVWRRTGATFRTWASAAPGTSPTCRFFSVGFAPRSSHFYTPYPTECDLVNGNGSWQPEGIAFHLQLPDAAGSCGFGSQPLYRLYNNGMGGAPNHRYTTDDVVFSNMRHAGWTFEGNEATGKFACVPRDKVGNTAQGIWRGRTSTNEQLYGIVLDDDSLYLFHTGPSGASVSGVIAGALFAVRGAVNSSSARDFTPAAPPLDAAILGSFIQRTAITGSIDEGSTTRTFEMSYDAAFEHGVDVPSVAGTYAGVASGPAPAQPASIVIAGDGSVSGTALGCTLEGRALPHGNVNVLDLSLTLAGSGCAVTARALSGVLFVDSTDGKLYAAAFDAARAEALLFTGSR